MEKETLLLPSHNSPKGFGLDWNSWKTHPIQSKPVEGKQTIRHEYDRMPTCLQRERREQQTLSSSLPSGGSRHQNECLVETVCGREQVNTNLSSLSCLWGRDGEEGDLYMTRPPTWKDGDDVIKNVLHSHCHHQWCNDWLWRWLQRTIRCLLNCIWRHSLYSSPGWIGKSMTILRGQ